jgi:histidyl-tRNA synthetase
MSSQIGSQRLAQRNHRGEDGRSESEQETKPAHRKRSARLWRFRRSPRTILPCPLAPQVGSVIQLKMRYILSAQRSTRADNINGKIQRAEQMKVHTMFVIGKRDMEADAVSVRIHGKGNLGAKPRSEAIAEILLSIKERRP